MQGVGDGTFGELRRYEVGRSPGAFALADTNGDGRIDVVVANECAIGAGGVRMKAMCRFSSEGETDPFAPQIRFPGRDRSDRPGRGRLERRWTRRRRRRQRCPDARRPTSPSFSGTPTGLLARRRAPVRPRACWTRSACSSKTSTPDGHRDLVLSSFYEDLVLVMKGKGDAPSPNLPIPLTSPVGEVPVPLRRVILTRRAHGPRGEQYLRRQPLRTSRQRRWDVRDAAKTPGCAAGHRGRARRLQRRPTGPTWRSSTTAGEARSLLGRSDGTFGEELPLAGFFPGAQFVEAGTSMRTDGENLAIASAGYNYPYSSDPG